MPETACGSTAPEPMDKPSRHEPESQSRATNWKGAEDVAVVLCQRLKTARVLNGYTIEEASRLIGYRGHKTQLSLFETYGETNGRDGRPPPIWVLMSAAKVYTVPTDYLLGCVDDADASRFDREKFALSRKVESQIARLAEGLGAQMARYAAEGSPAVAMSRELCERTREFLDVWQRFVTKNAGQFEDMLCGNAMVTAVEYLNAAYIGAQRQIDRHDGFGERVMQMALSSRPGATIPLFGKPSP